MKRCRPSACMFEPATYQICILGTLDKQWSDYYVVWRLNTKAF